MSSSLFESAAGSFEISRYPFRAQESLRAWNAADVLLVEQLLACAAGPGGILVVNDDQGALSVALQPEAHWTDSAMSTIAVQKNLENNSRKHVTPIASTLAPGTGFSRVALKIPKVLPYLEYQLALLAAAMAPGTALIAGGMDKHLSPRVASLLEHSIGPTERQRGRHKARTFTAIRDERPARPPPANTEYFCDSLDGKLVSMPNVFSREKIDIGSRFLLENLSQLKRASHLIDLACGNGILGLVARARNLCDTVVFCDESAMALESSRCNAQNFFSAASDAIRFHHGDGLLGYVGEKADLILCNPPFHSNHTVEEFVGRRLLVQCAGHLGNSGQLCLVANRHLRYLPTLKHGFSKVSKLAENDKFIIWLAQK